MPDAPSNFQYNTMTGQVTWDSVSGALEYEIISTPENDDDWKVVYSGGTATSVNFNQPAGRHKMKGKTKGTGGWGAYGTEEIIVIP
jgi:hypothetical protein